MTVTTKTQAGVGLSPDRTSVGSCTQILVAKAVNGWLAWFMTSFILVLYCAYGWRVLYEVRDTLDYSTAYQIKLHLTYGTLLVTSLFTSRRLLQVLRLDGSGVEFRGSRLHTVVYLLGGAASIRYAGYMYLGSRLGLYLLTGAFGVWLLTRGRAEYVRWHRDTHETGSVS
jgi:hypothetical protein